MKKLFSLKNKNNNSNNRIIGKKDTRLITGLMWLVSLIGLFVFWHLIATYIYRSVLFPSPAQFLLAAGRMLSSGRLPTHLLISIQRILAGFFLGSLIGIPIGMLMGSFKVMRLILEPYVEFFRFIPSIAMITVAVVWLGIGEASKVFLILWVTIFIVAINTTAGVSSIVPNKLRAADCLGASAFQKFIYVTLPATIPFMLTGMRIAMSGAFTTIVAAEMLGARDGLGALLWRARLYMLIDEIFVALVSLSLMGIIVDRLFRIFIKRFAGHFSPAV